MAKYFLCGVANCNAYSTSTGDLLFQSKTLLDTSIDIKTANTPIVGGYGNQKQFVYFHTGEMNIKLTDSQFSLNFIGANMGSTINTGKNLWIEQKVTLGVAGVGAVTVAPVIQPDISGSTIYGWWTPDKTGVTQKVTFTSSNFTPSGGAQNDTGTIRYFANNSAAQYITVPANIVPSVVRLVMDTQLFSGDGTAAGSSLVGSVQVEINRAQLTGNQSISMTASGVSNTPLEAMALAYTNTNGISSYATITQVLSGANWYDNVQFLVVSPDPLTLTTATSPLTVNIYAVPVPGCGSAFLVPDYTAITWTSSDATKFTVTNGVLSKVATGSANLTYSITNKSTVTGQTVVTIS